MLLDEILNFAWLSHRQALKRSKIDVQIEDGEDMAFKTLARLAREETKNHWHEKVDRYLDEGMVEDKAKYKANRKLREDELGKFMLKYDNLMQYLMQVRAGKIHSKVTKLTNELIEDGMDYKKAIKIAIRKYRFFFRTF